MIVKRIFYIFACVFAMAFNGNAQEKTKVVVNGLRLDNVYSREQMYEALGGVPDKIEEHPEYKEHYSFYYGKDVFYWDKLDCPDENGILGHGFGGCRLYTDRYVVLDSIRVGDSIEKLKTLGGILKDYCDEGVCTIRWRQSNAPEFAFIVVEFDYKETDLTKIITCINIYVHFI